MSTNIQLDAELRSDVGKGASRRLRRTGRVPAVLYGAGKDALSLTLDHNTIMKHLEDEAFYSQVLTVNIDGNSEQAVLRDLQRHPFKPAVQHMDLMRVRADQPIRVSIPLHFLNEERCPGVKDGGVLSRMMIDVEISALPKDLPEYIEVDVGELHIGDTIQLSELKVPESVEIVLLAQPGDHDVPVVSVQHVREEVAEPEEGEALEAADYGDEAQADESEGEDRDDSDREKE